MKSLFENQPRWTEATGKESDIVISSRIRLARNLGGYPFPARSSREVRVEVMESLRESLADLSFFSEHSWIDLGKLSMVERHAMVEEFVISPDFAGETAAGRAFSCNSAKTESLIVNEDDHLRFQVIESGFELEDAWHRISGIDDEIEEKVDYAFSSDFGYKTSSPSDMGTAMRASVILHLPALALSGNLSDLMEYAGPLGFVVSAAFGDNLKASGNVMQISNQWSMILSEGETIENLERITSNIIERERNARETIFFESRSRIEDMIFREFAILKYARLLPLDEFMSRFSIVRLGVETGILPEISPVDMNRLLIKVRPASLQISAGASGDTLDLDCERAKLVRSSFL